MHPLIEIDKFKDSEIESKINDLTSKYFMALNPDVKQQILVVLNMYKEELSARRQVEWNKARESRKDLDNLIKVN